MVIVLVKEVRLIVTLDDLNFKIVNVAFEAKVFNRYGTFDQITNRSMKNPGYAYLHCDLLDSAILTTITLKVKSPYIEMQEQHLQKGMFVKVENFGIESKFKTSFEKGDMHVVITIESITIVSSIPVFQPKLIPMFFHMDFIKVFKSFIQSWRSTTIAIIVISVRGVRDNKGEKQLLIANGKGLFDQNILVFGNNFRTKYEQFLETYNGGHCEMVLIKNVTTTTKED